MAMRSQPAVERDNKAVFGRKYYNGGCDPPYDIAQLFDNGITHKPAISPDVKKPISIVYELRVRTPRTCRDEAFLRLSGLNNSNFLPKTSFLRLPKISIF